MKILSYNGLLYEIENENNLVYGKHNMIGIGFGDQIAYTNGRGYVEHIVKDYDRKIFTIDENLKIVKHRPIRKEPIKGSVERVPKTSGDSF